MKLHLLCLAVMFKTHDMVVILQINFQRQKHQPI